MCLKISMLLGDFELSILRIFDSVHHDFDKLEVSSGSELKNKPDGWESTTKEQDGNLWEMSQREEDILLQEFDRRISFCKFQVPPAKKILNLIHQMCYHTHCNVA